MLQGIIILAPGLVDAREGKLEIPKSTYIALRQRGCRVHAGAYTNKENGEPLFDHGQFNI